MKYLIILILIVFSGVPANAAKRMYSEHTYQNVWCDARSGQMEYKLNDNTRVDCLLPDMAVEFDFANKWAECIGQSLHYGIKTHRRPACVLIMENGEKDLKYLRRLRNVAYKKGIRTFTMKPEHICNPAKVPNCPHLKK